jgi:hypothetical protein
MKARPDTDTDTFETAPEPQEITLPGGCMLCGGDLVLKVHLGGTAGSVCRACHWISRPHMHREDGAVHVTHPAGGLA